VFVWGGVVVISQAFKALRTAITNEDVVRISMGESVGRQIAGIETLCKELEGVK